MSSPADVIHDFICLRFSVITTVQRDLQSRYVLYSMFNNSFWVIVDEKCSKRCIFDCRSL